MKRALTGFLLLCLLAFGGMLTARADYTYENAMLYSDTSVVTLYQEPNGEAIGVAPACLRVVYDSAVNKGDWFLVDLGAFCAEGEPYQCYVKRDNLVDIENLYDAAWNAQYPELLPLATLIADTDIFEQPGSTQDPVGRLEANLTVCILAQIGDDLLIQCCEFVGFVPVRTLELTGAFDTLPFKAGDAYETTVSCADGGVVPVYSTCSTLGETKGTLQNGTTVSVMQVLNDYVQVAYSKFKPNDRGGFIPVQYFKGLRETEADTSPSYVIRSDAAYKRVSMYSADSVKSRATDLLYPDTPVTVLSDDGKWACVQFGEQKGYVQHSYVVESMGAAEPQVLVATGRTFISKYRGIDTDLTGDSILMVEPGDEMYLLGIDLLFSRQHKWLLVYSDGFYGYIDMVFVQPEDDTRAIPATLSAKAIHLFDRPSDKAKYVGKVGKNKAVTVLLHGDQWSLVRHEETEGYVKTKLINFAQ